MEYNDVIVVIPARKNSKRLKGKNLRELRGKPLISHTIEYALEFIDKKNIWVNSDDEQVIELANKYKISTYKRPSHLAEDETLTNEVIIDFCNFLVEQNTEFKYLITLQPTNPIRSINLLPDAMEKIVSSNRNSLMGVSQLHKKFGRIDNSIYLPENYNIGQRHQDLENLYFENGLIYISRKNCILNDKEYITKDVYPFLSNEIGSHVDIDYEEDLKFAELILTHISENEY